MKFIGVKNDLYLLPPTSAARKLSLPPSPRWFGEGNCVSAALFEEVSLRLTWSFAFADYWKLFHTLEVKYR